jgi:hypothetical protein
MKKEYISPVTKMVLVRLSGSVLDEPGMGGPSDRGFENLGKETLFEENQDDEGWAAQTNVWSSYDE